MDIDSMTYGELIKELIRIVKQVKNMRNVKMLYGFAIRLKESEKAE